MGKVGGDRNFGYGKQMAWAGSQALREAYGEGRYGTVAAHGERWGQFAAWARGEGIRDARQVDRDTVTAYGCALAAQVTQETMSVAYAQNLLSSVNVVLEALRGDRQVRVSPSALVGERGTVRDRPPPGLDRHTVQRCADDLRGRGEVRVAAVVLLARDLGLRIREASLLDARGALAQALGAGAINITEGTKGGRGHQVDRWVPASRQAVETLREAVQVQGVGRNLVPAGLSWRQWNDHLHRAWTDARGDHALARLHDLRAAYACDRYARLTGQPAPVVAGARLAPRDADREARAVIAHELGHGRTEVAAAYIGSGR